MELQIEELKKDVDFLLERSMQAGSCTFSGDRDTGASSNALVYFAYTGEGPNTWPSDKSDYGACLNAYLKLPPHRQARSVQEALRTAKNKI